MNSAVLVLLSLAVLVGCQPQSKKPDTTQVPPALSPTPPKGLPQGSSEVAAPVTTPTPSETPLPETVKVGEKAKVALILGPGGLRAYAHAGVLQEIHRSKAQVVAVGGLEMGALAAALYSQKPQAFEAEWQMMKLKEQDFFERGLMGGSSVKDLSQWNDYLKSVFGSARLEDGRLPFACVTLQLDRQQSMVVSKGLVTQNLAGCLAFPPLFKPEDRFVAGADQLGLLVQFFRQKGATHVIYVDLLSDRTRSLSKDESTAVVWSLVSSSLQAQLPLVQEVLKIPISGELNQFSQRKDLIQKGKEATAKNLNSILQKIGAF